MLHQLEIRARAHSVDSRLETGEFAFTNIVKYQVSNWMEIENAQNGMQSDFRLSKTNLNN